MSADTLENYEIKENENKQLLNFFFQAECIRKLNSVVEIHKIKNLNPQKMWVNSNLERN